MKEIPKEFFIESTREHMNLYKKDPRGLRKPAVMYKLLAKKYSSKTCVMKTIITWVINLFNRKVYADYNDLTQALTCKKRFVFIDLRLHSTVLKLTHQNLIIIDNKLKTIERFDPVGSKHIIHLTFSLLKKSPDKIFEETFSSVPRLKNYRYISPRCYQKVLDIQTKEGMNIFSNRKNEPSGFCQMWALYIMHLKLINQSLTTSEILKHVRTKSSKTLHKLIRDYTSYWISSY